MARSIAISTVVSPMVGRLTGRVISFTVSAAHRIAAVLAECHTAQRRGLVLALAPDRQFTNPGRAPETYPEFLYRTSGPLLHEPAAADRATRSVA